MNISDTPQPTFRRRGITLSKIDWPVTVGMLALHVGAILAPWTFSWSGLIVCLFLMWFTGNIGITLCYHRLLTHRSFRTPKWFEYVLAIIGCTAWQGGPAQWVGVHRIHHAHSDEENDPHTPKHGFGWAHMFWCMHKEPDGRKGVDAARDLLRDPIMRTIHKLFWLPQFLLAGLLFAAGEWVAAAGIDAGASGLSWLIWGVCLRAVVVYHGTWFVNSATHTWGYRNFNTSDNSTNLWWVALLSFGEGWHNNHHAHQRSAAHGLRWFEIDVTYWTIRLLGLVGLASDIVVPRPEERPQKKRSTVEAAADELPAVGKPAVPNVR